MTLTRIYKIGAHKMKPLKPKYDDMSEEDFYLGFMLIVKKLNPSLLKAIKEVLASLLLRNFMEKNYLQLQKKF